MILSLLEFALRALLVAAAVWSGLRLMGVRDVLAQKAAWGLVLAASVLMPVLLPFALRWQILPAGFALALPAHPLRTAASLMASSPVITGAASDATAAKAATPTSGPASASPTLTIHNYDAKTSIHVVAPISANPLRANSAVVPMTNSGAATPHSTIQIAPPMNRYRPEPARPLMPSLVTLAWTLYLAVCALLLVRLLYGITTAVGLWLDAEPLSLDEAPLLRLRSSRAVASPVTIGSGVILPVDYDQWAEEKLRIVLAHERSHVRQGDFYLQLLAGLYSALFWFSPLGWWLKRTLSDLGEAISDRAGLEVAASRSAYAQILLEFAAAPRPTLIGVAMARPSSLSHRIERLLNESSFRQAFSTSRLRAMLAVLLVPAAFFGATALIRVEAASQPNPAATPAPMAHATQAPSPAAAPAAVAAPEPFDTPTAAEPAPAAETAFSPAHAYYPTPAAPVAPPAPRAILAPPAIASAYAPVAPAYAPVAALAPMPPSAVYIGRGYGAGYGVALAAGQSSSNIVRSHNGHRSYISSGSGQGYSYSFDSDGESYALVTGAADGVRFSGDWMDGRRQQIKKASEVAHGKFLWFTHDGKFYVIDDAAIIDGLVAMYKPMDDLGRQQEELGKKQEELGRQQEELGRKQEQASVPTPDISKEIAELNAALAKLQSKKGSTITQEELGDIQGKIGEIQGRIGEIEGSIGEVQGKLGEAQGKLGEKQGELGEQQGKLGEEQGRIAEQVDRKVKTIIDEGLQNGKARQVQ